jgi:hypothetical protein
MERNTTTIALHRSTVQRLGELGKFNESYEDVVNRLLDNVDNTRAGRDP